MYNSSYKTANMNFLAKTLQLFSTIASCSSPRCYRAK